MCHTFVTKGNFEIGRPICDFGFNVSHRPISKFLPHSSRQQKIAGDGSSNAPPSPDVTMVGKRKCLGFRLGIALIAVSIALAWYALGADSRGGAVTSKATKFQFARMRYPGGIPDYVKNWYTDYPNMDDHLTQLLH